MSPKRQLRGGVAVAMLSMGLCAGLATAQAQTSPAPAATQTNPTGTVSGSAATPAGATTLSKSDRRFIRKAAEGNLAEVALGRLAEQNSQDSSVKAFGERMVQDHSQANQQLTTVAQNLNVTLPTSPSSSDQKVMDKLSGLSGPAFDKAFARDMVRGHRMDVRAFEHEAKHGRDPDVKQFAESTLPTIREHLAMAEKLPGAPSHRTASAATSNQTATQR
jgi:putative membrane protein